MLEYPVTLGVTVPFTVAFTGTWFKRKSTEPDTACPFALLFDVYTGHPAPAAGVPRPPVLSLPPASHPCCAGSSTQATCPLTPAFFDRRLLFVQAILHRQLVYPGHLSSDAVSFLSTALTRDPRTRPTVKELLQHPFIAMHTSNQQQ